MAFSGTVSQTVFNLRKVMDRAFGRCRLAAATISSEHLDIAKDELYLLISEMANYGVPLWCVERQVYPLYEGVGDVVLDVGVVDVLAANLRQITILNGQVTATPTEYEMLFEDVYHQPVFIPVNVVGIKWAGASSPLAFERSDDGLTWTTIQTETPVAVAGEWSWFDIGAVEAAPLFLVRAVTGVLDYEVIVLANNPTEIPLARLNRDDWWNLPNKTMQGRPLQYWFDRQVRQQVMHLWCVPNRAHEAYQLVLNVHRHIMDVGTLQQEIEVPQRWYNALVAMLASRIAGGVPEVDAALVPVLDAKAKEALYTAQQEERDNSPINWAPMIGVYTR